MKFRLVKELIVQESDGSYPTKDVIPAGTVIELEEVVEEVMQPCSCPKGGIDENGRICRKCDGNQWVEEKHVHDERCEFVCWKLHQKNCQPTPPAKAEEKVCDHKCDKHQ